MRVGDAVIAVSHAEKQLVRRALRLAPPDLHPERPGGFGARAARRRGACVPDAPLPQSEMPFLGDAAGPAFAIVQTARANA